MSRGPTDDVGIFRHQRIALHPDMDVRVIQILKSHAYNQAVLFHFRSYLSRVVVPTQMKNRIGKLKGGDTTTPFGNLPIRPALNHFRHTPIPVLPSRSRVGPDVVFPPRFRLMPDRELPVFRVIHLPRLWIYLTQTLSITKMCL